MKKKTLVLVLALGLLLAFSVMLAGCGGSEEDAVKNSVKGFATAFNAEDYEKCTDYMLGVTDATKEGAIDGLKAAKVFVEEMEVIKIENVKIDGSTATADVTYKVTLASTFGGGTQESTQKATLTKENGKWKFEMDDFLSMGE